VLAVLEPAVVEPERRAAVPALGGDERIALIDSICGDHQDFLTTTNDLESVRHVVCSTLVNLLVNAQSPWQPPRSVCR
jgi:hypothetical protein